MPMYRNPSLDDPSVKGLSRSTANTHVIQHRNLLLALKEDSAPSALDLNTLETLQPVYTFDGQLPPEQPFTAHPKVCSRTGNIVAFGYEARGFGSDAIAVFEIDRAGRKVWGAEVRMPFVSSVHDFAVTENHIAFFLIPLAIDHEQMRRGGIHWSWDKDRKKATWDSCAVMEMARTCAGSRARRAGEATHSGRSKTATGCTSTGKSPREIRTS
jgi:carotenoid cleavage dioxygenase